MWRTNKFHDDDNNCTSASVITITTRSNATAWPVKWLATNYTAHVVSPVNIKRNRIHQWAYALLRESARRRRAIPDRFEIRITSSIRTILMTFVDFIYGVRGASHKRTNEAGDSRQIDNNFRSLMRLYGSFVNV